MQARCHQTYRAHYAPRHQTELLKISGVLEAAAEAEGVDQEVARRALKLNQAKFDALVTKREQATQLLLAAFDPDEVTRLYANAEFTHAVDELADPDAIVNAVLAIHQARCGGVDSILDTAAALLSQAMAAAECVATYEYFEQLYSCLRNITVR